MLYYIYTFALVYLLDNKTIFKKKGYKENMKQGNHYIHDELNCIYSGHKPRNLHSWGPGVRDIYALHYIISGKGYLETNNVKYEIKEGESFLIFPNTEIHYYPDMNDPWEYIWIEFNGDEALRLLSMTSLSRENPVAQIFPVGMEHMFKIMDNDNLKPYEKERTNARLRILLSYYMEYYPKATNVVKKDYVITVLNYIKNNYWKTSLTVADIVKAVKIERTYLYKLFKKGTGMPILSYLTSYRVKCACALLKATDLTIKSIAYSVGFEDQMHFSKVFKKYASCSPSEYRFRK